MIDNEKTGLLDKAKLEELEKEKKKRRRVGRMMIFWRRFYRHKMGVIGLSVIVFVVFLGVSAPYIAGEGKIVPFDPRKPNLQAQYLPPLSFESSQDENASQKLGGKEKTLGGIFVDELIYFTNGKSNSPLSYFLSNQFDRVVANQLSQIDSIVANDTGEELWIEGQEQFNHTTGIITLKNESFTGSALINFRVGGKIALNFRPLYDTISGFKFKLKVDTTSQESSWTQDIVLSLYKEGENLTSAKPLGTAKTKGYTVLTGGALIKASFVDFNFPVRDFFSPGIKVEINNTYTVVVDSGLLEMESRGVDQRLYIEATGDYFDPSHETNMNWNALTGWNTETPTPTEIFYKEEGWMTLVLVYHYTNRFHVFGTDALGRDILSATIWGATASMSVAFLAQSISICLGISCGAIAGYYGGLIDNLLMRIADIFLAIPGIFLLLMAVSIWEQITLPFIAITIGLLGWSGTARLVRAEFLHLREMEYIEAAHALGVQDRTIIFKHLLPNSLSPVIVNVSLGIAAVILIEAGLSFLGFGDPLAVSWGTAIQWGMQGHTLRFAPWVATIPGLAIFVVVIAFNLMGDALRDALDPRLKN